MAAATGVDSPSPDQVTIIRVVAGQPIDLPIDPQQLADAQLQIVGGDLEIKLPDGHIFLLVGFVKAEESGQAPDIVVESGEHMSAEDVLALTGTSLEDLLQTAAGGAQAGTGTANNSASFRHGFLGGLINGLNDEGPIGPTALQYGVPEPLTGPIDKLDDSDQRALMQWHIEGDPLVHEPFFGGKQQQEFRELVAEGTFATYTVFYTGAVLAPGQTASITVETGAGHHDSTPDATGGADYETLSTILTFTGGGATSQTLEVQIFGDTVVEGTEDYSVNLSGQSHGTIVDPTQDTDIVDETSGPFWNIQGDSVVHEGDTAVYTVSYNGAVLAPGITATVTVLTGAGTNGSEPDATSGTDYTALTTVLTFTGGSATAQTVEVHTTDDTVVEGTEDYSVQLADPSHGVISIGTAPTDIIDDDAQNLQWSITGDSLVNEGNAAVYTVTYTGAVLAPGITATVTVQTGPGTNGSEPDADSNTDYTSLSTVLTFTGGDSNAQTVSVQTVDDTLVEGTEDYSVQISGQSAGNITQGTAPTDIVDNDAPNMQWSVVGDSLVSEGNTAIYTVSYSGAVLAPGQTATITVQTGPGTNGSEPDADSNTDYTALSTVLTFTGGQTSQTVEVHTTDDTLIEGTEDYSVNISGQSAGTITQPTAPTDIIDNDHISQWNITGDSLVTEGEVAVYTVSYTGGVLAPGQTATITVQTGPGTNGSEPDAEGNTDYTSLSTVLTFTGGQTSQTVSVQTVDDTLVEGTEDYSVHISGPSSGAIGIGTAPTDIIDSDHISQWNITGSTQVTEGDTAIYTVSYTGGVLASGQTATIVVETGPGTNGSEPDAEGNTDYTSLSTTLTFTGGQTAQTVAVHTVDDTLIEGTEDYSVQISGQSAGTIGVGTAPTDIIDGDHISQWNIAGDSLVTEGNTAIYTVSYTGGVLAPGQTATITVQTGPGTKGSEPDATAPSDYTALSTVLTFTGGQTAQTVAVHTNTDTVIEGTEDYSVQISGQSAGTIGTGTAPTDIVDQTTGPFWNITGSTQVNEGSDATYTVSYTGATLAPGQTALVTIQTGDHAGGSPNATEGTDYNTRDGFILTFTGGGGTAQTLTVHTNTDTVVEGTEDYQVSINPSIGTISTGTATTDIVDQTTGPVWNIAGSTQVNEGSDATYTVSYTGATLAPGQTALVTIQTGDHAGGSPNATEGTDYNTRDGFILTFTGGGGTAQTLTVHTNTDTVVEGTEDYQVSINPSIGTTGTGTATTDIVDQTTGPVWNIAGSTQVNEGSDATYTVSYTGATLAPGQTALVTIQTGDHAGGSPNATEGTDYNTRDGFILTFTGGGGTAQTLTVHTNTDTVVEGTEDYQVSINPSIGTTGTGTATTDIVDQTTGPFWNITGSTQVNEGSDATYTVSYTGATLAPGQTALVTIQTGDHAGGSPNATEGTDYNTRDGFILTFTGGGGTAQTLTVHTNTDTVVEGTEDYQVSINPSIGTISTGTATTDIVDQTTGPVWNITGSTQVNEGSDATYTVSYTGATLAPGQTALVTIQTGDHAGGSPNATEGTDYNTRDGFILTFTGGGGTAQTLTVHTNTDTVVEGTEDYQVSINPSIGTTGTGTATTDIVDQTTGPFWNITGSTQVNEGSDATYTVSYTGATLAPGQTALVTIQTGDHAGGSPNATEGTDYNTRDGFILTFTGGGGTAQTLTVHTNTDTVVEGTEDYQVSINPSIGTISTGTATTDIVDQTTGPVWNIAGSTQVNEGSDATYTVSYTGATLAPGQTALVTIQTGDHAGGSPNATEGTDYNTRDGFILTFTGGGGTAQTLTVHTVDDTVVEGTEDYQISITPSVGAIGTGTATTNIIDNDKYVPHGGNDTCSVLERGVEAVALGNFSEGTNAIGNEEIAAGNLTYSFGGDGKAASQPFTWSGTVSAVDPETSGSVPLTSGGQAITWTVSNGGLTITGTVASGPHAGGVVAKLEITDINTGAYKFEQLGAIDHPDAGTNGSQVNGNDQLQLTFTYTVKDAVDADTANGTLKVSVGDDGPVANPEEKTAAAAGSVDTNLMIVLDLSGSMTDDSGLQGLDRLQASKAAINELFEQYHSLGDVKVQIVTFSGSADTQNYNGSGGIWLSLSDAKAFINSLGAGGSTNYDAALQQAIQAYADAGKIDPVGNPQPVQNVAYFISDGDPTSASAWSSIPGDTTENGINANEESAWIQFLKDNDINSYAIGIGTGITVSNLNPVAYNGAVESNTNGAQVSDLSQLAQFLSETAQNNITGNVMSDNGTEIGADGGYVKSISYGNSVFTFNGTSSITRNVGGTVVFSTSGNLLTITTAYGTMQINMLSGAYTFTVASGVGVVPPEAFNFVLHDNDGDEAGNSLTINLTPSDSAPIARDDSIIIASGNTTPLIIDDKWLLWNDSDADGDVMSIVAAANGGTLVGGDVQINTLNGSFDYTAQSTTLTDDAHVTTSSTTSTTINGNGVDNIIIGDGDNELIRGYEGNDVLVGNGGNDTLAGGTGNDLLVGGAGTDVADLSDHASGLVVALDASGNATVTADGSTDVLQGMEGVIGGNGADSLSGNLADNYFDGGNGNDTLFGGDGNDYLVGGGGTDSLNGGNNDDTLVGDSSNPDTLAGGSGTDTADFSGYASNRDITLVLNDSGNGTANVSGSGDDALFSIENVLGGSGDDHITGGSPNNLFMGNSGDDTLEGGGGDDTLYGGTGEDSLDGGSGNDYLDGGTSTGGGQQDTLFGGDGDDTLLFGATDDTYNGGGDIDTLKITADTNFSNFSQSVSRIEILDMTGNGNQTLTLNHDDVLDFTGDDDNAVTKNFGGSIGTKTIEMFIKGNAGDSVDLPIDNTSPFSNDTWHSTGQTYVVPAGGNAYGAAGTTYNLYIDDDNAHVIAVQNGVTVS
ncbi:Calx-beta domain-containing protein [Hypericibacter adhaerens]|nr:Calx-beta domain-containing protein [Hypericibacter adhaerens]